jgi:6-pyruvoyltetrahydropterin/6-carboxytetrahydropterin synthase
MTIVKKFEIEMAHIVRNAWSSRCAKSIHGHTYTIEVALTRNDLSTELHDSGRMVVDFGEVKKYLHPFIDSFDHAVLLWSEDKPEIIDFFKNNFERVIVCPESSSCEMMSAFFLVALQRIIQSVPELKDVELEEVIVHETRTGRAHCHRWCEWVDAVIDRKVVENIWFSPALVKEWPDHLYQLAISGDIGTPSITPLPPAPEQYSDECYNSGCCGNCVTPADERETESKSADYSSALAYWIVLD